MPYLNMGDFWTFCVVVLLKDLPRTQTLVSLSRVPFDQKDCGGRKIEASLNLRLGSDESDVNLGVVARSPLLQLC